MLARNSTVRVVGSHTAADDDTDREPRASSPRRHSMPGWTGGGREATESDPDSWPYAVERREDVWIELPSCTCGSSRTNCCDRGAGASAPLRLSASLWLPRSKRPQSAADRLVVPAVLEYLPYRWGDATYYRDYCRHPCAV